MAKTAVLLVNVGTPDLPDNKSVRKYLHQFLNDKRVIDIPWLLRKILVNLIIVPFRVPKSTNLYKKLWDVKGSPLLYYTLQLKEKIKKILPDNYNVFVSMRYGNPSLNESLIEIKDGFYDEIIVLPMFPQYASSTTGTINAYINSKIQDWEIIPNLCFINKFYTNNDYLESVINRINENKPDHYDHILFSYHGLPLRQIDKCHPEISSNTCSCTQSMPDHGHYCYKAQCYETSRLIASRLNLKKDMYTTAFQSRLSKNWLEPFSDKKIIEFAEKGIKSMLVVAPSFVIDCLETNVEIEIEYAELFKKHGGEKFIMVKALNDADYWASTIVKLIQNK